FDPLKFKEFEVYACRTRINTVSLAQSVNITDFSPDQFTTLVSKCPMLQTVRLREVERDLPRDYSSFQRLRFLTKLDAELFEVHSQFWSEVIAPLTHLKYLRLSVEQDNTAIEDRSVFDDAMGGL